MDSIDLNSFEYVDVSNSRKSEVWKHFLFNKELEKAQCKICSCVFKSRGTTGILVAHLRNKHDIAIKRRMLVSSTSAVPSKTARIEGESIAAETSFKQRQSIGEVIAELVLLDGFTFNQIANSKILRRCLQLDGYEVPQSAQTVRDIFIKEYRKNFSLVKNSIALQKSRGKRFSISLDESTTKRNRR